MAQILAAKVRIFKRVAFPICWCPQLTGCSAEQFILQEFSPASCDSDANIHSRRGKGERLKLKTHKIKTNQQQQQKNPEPKSPVKERLRTLGFFFPLMKTLSSFNHPICLASVQTCCSSTLATVPSLFLIPALVCLYVLLCHRFARARLWNWAHVGRG